MRSPKQERPEETRVREEKRKEGSGGVKKTDEERQSKGEDRRERTGKRKKALLCTHVQHNIKSPSKEAWPQK